MRAYRRHLLAALIAAVALALPVATTTGLAAVTASDSDIHHCPLGTAWDNVQHRCD